MPKRYKTNKSQPTFIPEVPWISLLCLSSLKTTELCFFNTVYVVYYFKLKPHLQLSCLKTTLNLSLELVHYGKRACGFAIISRRRLICAGFLKFTMGNPNATSSHSEPHVSSHFEIIKGTGMNSPRGTNLIAARNFVSVSVSYLIWTDGGSLYSKLSVRGESYPGIVLALALL